MSDIPSECNRLPSLDIPVQMVTENGSATCILIVIVELTRIPDNSAPPGLDSTVAVNLVTSITCSCTVQRKKGQHEHGNEQSISKHEKEDAVCKTALKGNANQVAGRTIKFQNWAQTYGSTPELYFQPTCAEEVKEILDLARQRSKRVKVVGGGHSPSDIACTDDFMIRLDKMNKVLKVDREKKQVAVEAGMLLSELNEVLTKNGMALSNIGAVSEVAAAGVIGTGTHNTGITHGILSTQVMSLTMMTASGDVVECSASENADIFRAARLHLGSLGVILTVTLQCRPAYRLQEVQFPSTLPEVLDNLDTHLKASEYFRFWWFPHTESVSIFYQDPTDKPPFSKANWFWDCFVGYYLLEFLLWIRYLETIFTFLIIFGILYLV
ncbi:LOW QUALITY PROTEIN: L-gulonolactone oxidase-like [Mantella aurantiaca]